MSLGRELTSEFQRTHYNNQLRSSNSGEKVVLNGWVQNRRDHGGIIFIDLRDIKGVTQIVFDPNFSKQAKEAHTLADAFRGEYVIAIQGTVANRLEGMANSRLETGDIEVFVENVQLLNASQTLPFQLDEYDNTNEELRLKYRYLDLRRVAMQQNILTKHNMYKSIRNSLYNMDFNEIETPYLTKSTPEGARDFLVPSRVNKGTFFALPQSPQIFKQLLMAAGYEKYFQIVRCFRDEDLRADRQPEFTQLDVEMSFAMEPDVMNMAEQIVSDVMLNLRGTKLGNVPQITYQDAMDKYGNDKPDIRFEMLLHNITDVVKGSGFKVFDNAINNGGIVKGIKAEKANLSRKDIDDLTNYVAQFGAKGLAYIRINEDGLQSPITKFLGDEITANIVKHMDANVGDIIFFAADAVDTVNDYMSRLRLKLGEILGLMDANQFKFLWVVDFPLLEYSTDEKRYVAVHHPFTAPQGNILDADGNTEVGNLKARAYDLVLNGNEIAGGSIRIHNNQVQEKVFELLGINADEANNKFGFLLDAMKYGFPPHGGIAFGLDRLAAILCGVDSIRDVIPFPKTQRATDAMSNAPTEVTQAQLSELGLIQKKFDK